MPSVGYGATMTSVDGATTEFDRQLRTWRRPDAVGATPEALVDRLFGPGPWRAMLVNSDEVAGSRACAQRAPRRRATTR
jgi:hypothetical protein